MKKNITIVGAGHFGMVLHDVLVKENVITLIKRGDKINLSGVDFLLVALPVKEYDSVFADLAATTTTLPPTILFSKGMNSRGQLPMAIIAQYFPAAPIAVLAGPNFAFELKKKLPTASVLASHDNALITAGQQLLQQPFWRIYKSRDAIGVQLNGVMKNVLAVAVGIARGKKLGENAYATLISRGLAEMRKLLAAEKSAGTASIDDTTCYGLSGVGDLVLTAGSPQSRNTALGIKLGEGLTISDALAQSRGVAEGYHAAAQLNARAIGLGIDLPIVATVAAVLHDGLSVDKAIHQLLSRPMPARE
ncbi:MAG: NAD(P)H-dependent glycerol-3-phosphate dehydrogenase [Hydrotalea sp.]|nr:NAD(P)H-dependent glycerol-3-phosphate dehydrogenase [Hydrotalea sp.]MDI9314471.1 NAD(P)H-dependent glycerol-3-phosphate dehydrogenase [Hydrotalea sp.]